MRNQKFLVHENIMQSLRMQDLNKLINLQSSRLIQKKSLLKQNHNLKINQPYILSSVQLKKNYHGIKAQIQHSEGIGRRNHFKIRKNSNKITTNRKMSLRDKFIESSDLKDDITTIKNYFSIKKDYDRLIEMLSDREVAQKLRQELGYERIRVNQGQKSKNNLLNKFPECKKSEDINIKGNKLGNELKKIMKISQPIEDNKKTRIFFNKSNFKQRYLNNEIPINTNQICEQISAWN